MNPNTNQVISPQTNSNYAPNQYIFVSDYSPTVSPFDENRNRLDRYFVDNAKVSSKFAYF